MRASYLQGRHALRGLALLVGLLLTLQGCASLSGYPRPTIKPKAERASLKPYLSPNVIATYDNLTSEPARRAYRDEVVFGRLRAYDLNFQQFEKALTGQNNAFSIGTDWTILALNGLGATVGDAAAKSALAAASAGIVGAKGSVDKDLFYQKTLPALIAQMQARRATVLARIEAGLTQPTTAYPLARALFDLGRYGEAGSIPGAINGIVENAGAEKAKADQAITFTRDRAFIAQALPNIKMNAARIKALNATQTLALAAAMKPNLSSQPPSLKETLTALYPKWLTDAGQAQAALLLWNRMYNKTPQTQTQWSDALDSVSTN